MLEDSQNPARTLQRSPECQGHAFAWLNRQRLAEAHQTSTLYFYQWYTMLIKHSIHYMYTHYLLLFHLQLIYVCRWKHWGLHYNTVMRSPVNTDVKPTLKLLLFSGYLDIVIHSILPSVHPQGHMLYKSLLPMLMTKPTGTVPSWCIAFCKDSRISLWILTMVSNPTVMGLQALMFLSVLCMYYPLLHSANRILAVLNVLGLFFNLRWLTQCCWRGLDICILV